MILKNYHTHTYRCHHAKGSDREYIEAAIKAGIKTLGFSDHAPQAFRDGYVGPFRMLPEVLPEYVESLSALREEYKGQIELLIGLEMEYYPLLFADTMELVREQKIDYMLLSHHCFGNEFDLRYPKGHPNEGSYIHSYNLTDSEELLRDYVNQEVDGIRTGLFSYLCHPDIISFTGDRAVYKREMGRLCEAAKEYDLPLEVNLLGLRGHRSYPSEEFWEIAAEVGNCAIFGFDAHSPEAFTNYPAAEEEAERLLSKYGITRTEEIKFPLK